MKVINYVVFLGLFAMASCGPKMKAQRLTTAQGDEKAMYMTDNWLATDTRNAVVETLKQMQNSKKYKNYMKKNAGKKPKLFIAEIQNNTSEAYFPIQDFNDEMLMEISNGDEFILIDEKARDKILNEIQYQNDGMVDPKDVKSIGKHAGADVMIFGTINMKPEMLEGKTIKEYSVNIRMTDITTGTEIVRTRYQLSKYSERKGYSW